MISIDFSNHSRIASYAFSFLLELHVVVRTVVMYDPTGMTVLNTYVNDNEVFSVGRLLLHPTCPNNFECPQPTHSFVAQSFGYRPLPFHCFATQGISVILNLPINGLQIIYQGKMYRYVNNIVYPRKGSSGELASIIASRRLYTFKRT